MLRITAVSKKDEYTFGCEPDDTILRAALRAGIGFPYACNVGSCGNCRFTLLEGAVAHVRSDAPAWSERDQKRNRFLGCQARPLSDCRIQLRVDSSYLPTHKPVRTRAVLTESIELTHDISEFAFKLETPVAFRPGQYALLYVPGIEGGRAYSMCNIPGNIAEWRFQIKHVPGGQATSALFGQVRPGDSVALDGPYGTAFFREDSQRDIVCIAGGSGLSPMISIIRAAAEQDRTDRQIDFVYGGRTSQDIIGDELLAALPGFRTNIHFHAAISNPEQDQGEWRGPVGFVHELTGELFGEKLRDREIYFAGPPPMAAATQKLLADLNVPADQVHFDEFY